MKYLKTLLIMLVFTNCKKDHTSTCSDGIKNQTEIEIDCGGDCSPCKIEYPETGNHGVNVLHGNDTIVITDENCSMKAQVPIGSSLKIELNLVSGEAWFYANEQNWVVSSFSDDKQIFTALNGNQADLMLHNANNSNIDTILVRYFENSNNETKRKIIIRK
jgi:hypothetical protein